MLIKYHSKNNNNKKHVFLREGSCMDSFPLQILFPDLGLMCAEFIHSFWGNNREWNMNLFQTRNRYGQLFVEGGCGVRSGQETVWNLQVVHLVKVFKKENNCAMPLFIREIEQI